MCLTLAGRIQTRAITLVNGLFLAILYSTITGNLVYFIMLFWMIGVAVVLDLFVYSRWIRFQPRWLTILIGGLEFLLLLMVVPGPTDIGQMAGFYFPAWLAGWLTMEIVLPVVKPCWVEDGGEIWRI